MRRALDIMWFVRFFFFVFLYIFSYKMFEYVLTGSNQGNPGSIGVILFAGTADYIWMKKDIKIGFRILLCIATFFLTKLILFIIRLVLTLIAG